MKAQVEALNKKNAKLEALLLAAQANNLGDEKNLNQESERSGILLQLYSKALQLNDQELYEYTLDQAVQLTDSTIGFFHMLSDDQKDVILTTWNQAALGNCTALYEYHYPVEEAGNWVDCVRLKRPVIYNDFPNSPNQKGLAEGHTPVMRFMSIPVLEGDKVRIILGVGNKNEPYEDRDVVQLQLVANELHKIIRLRSLQRDKDKAETALQKAYDEMELQVKKRTLQLRRQIRSQYLLLEISKTFNSILINDIDEMINITLRRIGEFDRNDHSYVAVFSDDQSTVATTYEWCAEGIVPAIYSLRGLRATDVLPWMKDNLKRLEYTYIPRVAELPPEAQIEREMMQAQSIQSLIIVPMFLEDKIIGFLGFDSVRAERKWSKENIIILESAAQTIAKALQRKNYGRALEASADYYRTIFENTGAATMIIEADMTVSMVNDECARLSGYTKEDLFGKKWTEFICEDMLITMQEYHRMRRIHPADVPLKYQTRMIDREGNYREGLVAVDMIPGTNQSVATFVDFTEFNRIDRALKAISAVNIAMIQAKDEQELLGSVCAKIVEVGGYSLAWVGYLGSDQPQTVHPVASAGQDKGYLAKLKISLHDPQRGRGPAAAAIRTGQPVVYSDLSKNEAFKPWSKNAVKRGFKSNMALPLRADNKAFGVLCIYSSSNDRFDTGEQQLLIEIANDLGYAITSMRTRTQHQFTTQELENSLAKMKRILLQEVTSLGNALNVKDPFTSGHQKKVAHLATAIAEEMGLSVDQVEGIEVAGNLHDIGKISIPSEILNKPGRLSDLECEYIKTHSQAGYEIVKEIEFPWPVAEVILQHHERLDGSGYPRGLLNNDLLIEARILAVADVVEAMASHRPYRPALGVKQALEEITQNRGILYDPEVVDTCLKLFREKDFKLE